jgi:intermembrane space import and assembly protein 40
MQECFRQYPEIYGSELEDDEAEAGTEEADAAAPAAAVAPSEAPAATLAETLAEEERQQLRDDSNAKGRRHSDGAETDNLPGVKLVESSAPRVADEKKEQK